MKARLLVCMVASLAGMVALADARMSARCSGIIEMTAQECKSQFCEKNLRTSQAVCAELPANKSCPDLARSLKRGCDEACDEKYPTRIDLKPRCDEK